MTVRAQAKALWEKAGTADLAWEIRLLQRILEGRVQFTPRPGEDAVDFVGRLRLGAVLAGALTPAADRAGRA